MSGFPTPEPTETRWPPQLTAWERATHMPLLALALLFLVAFAVPILYPGIPGWARTAATGVYVLVWLVYAIDFAIRLKMAGRGNRLRFIVTHPLDLIMVLLPLLRPLRVVRIVVLLTEVFRRHAEASKRFQAAFYVVTVTTMILLIASLAILDAERDVRGTQIAGFSDALWWSIVTTTTVGYGDMVPQTTEGRAIAAFLMFAGIGLFGLVSGSLASWFVDRVSSPGETAERAEVSELRERMERMEHQLAEIHEVLVRDASSADRPPEDRTESRSDAEPER